MLAERILDKARDYDLNARAYADRPDEASQKTALVFSAVAIALREIAAELDSLEEAA